MSKSTDKLAAALTNVDDLDLLAALYITSELADQAPAFQSAMRNLWQAELRRRAGEEIEGLPLPEFSKWHPGNLLVSGPTVISATEAAAITGDPTLMAFAFALLQYWFIQLSTQCCEEIPCAQN